MKEQQKHLIKKIEIKIKETVDKHAAKIKVNHRILIRKRKHGLTHNMQTTSTVMAYDANITKFLFFCIIQTYETVYFHSIKYQ